MTRLTKTERAKLELEYRELCEDWRWRDKYVLDKLSAAGILFGLIGVALGALPSTAWVIKLCLAFIGALFSFILSISVAKDTYYRDGTEELLRRLSIKLGISGSLQNLESLKVFLDDRDRPFSEFPRKIKIKEEESSLKIPGWLRDCLPEQLTFWLRDCLLKQSTFKWILAFYLVSLVIFAGLFVLILVNSICKLNLPI